VLLKELGHESSQQAGFCNSWVSLGIGWVITAFFQLMLCFCLVWVVQRLRLSHSCCLLHGGGGRLAQQRV
jgi:hypothetical protein